MIDLKRIPLTSESNITVFPEVHPLPSSKGYLSKSFTYSGMFLSLMNQSEFPCYLLDGCSPCSPAVGKSKQCLDDQTGKLRGKGAAVTTNSYNRCEYQGLGVRTFILNTMTLTI